ncbi:MAG: hypothetical protein Kow0029_20220 [Candidatus Rifleibacteriota bacterium]
MKNISHLKKYHVKEAVGATNLHEYYLIINPENNSTVAEVIEEATFWQKFAKVFVDKAFVPAKLVMRSLTGEPILFITKTSSGLASIFKSEFVVKNPDGKVLCVFKQKLSFFKPEIIVADEQGLLLGTLEGGWKFRNFYLKDVNKNVVATIRHQFAGLAKELFTTADDYEVNVNSDASMSLIALAATICIDFMFHEN